MMPDKFTPVIHYIHFFELRATEEKYGIYILYPEKFRNILWI
jgi:hypothetical protein